MISEKLYAKKLTQSWTLTILVNLISTISDKLTTPNSTQMLNQERKPKTKSSVSSWKPLKMLSVT